MAFARAVVLTGGPTHDFPATTGCLSTLLHEQGLVAELHEDVDDGLRALPGASLLVVNALRWTMRAPAHRSGTGCAPTRTASAPPPTPAPR